MQFEKYEFVFDAVCDALKGLPKIQGENSTSLADRLEIFFNDKLKGLPPLSPQ